MDGRLSRADLPVVRAFIEYLAQASDAFAGQAGVGGMETAGSAVSYLAANPQDIEPFLNRGFFELPVGWHERGSLTWHSQDGRVISPEYARRHRTITKLAKLSAEGE